jgi:hypothetical protein
MLMILVTSSPAMSQTAADADFMARCSSPGVLRCVGFDAASDITGRYGDNTGLGIGFPTAAPVLDTTVKASGNSSLMFTIPSNSNDGASGYYFANFTNNIADQVGEGQEIYVQWRQRFSPELLTTRYWGTYGNPGDCGPGSPGCSGGFKQFSLSEGDRPPGYIAPSCVDIDVPVQNIQQGGFPMMYHSCGVKDGHYESLQYYDSALNAFTDQNNVPNCTTATKTGCFYYQPNEWMTFQMHVKVGTWYKNDGVYHHDSTVQLWMAREGQPSVLIIDWSPQHLCINTTCGAPAGGTNTGYDLVNLSTPLMKFGKIYLLPYQTQKDPTQTHPTAYTWYDELIISKSRIPDPGVPANTPSPPNGLSVH